MEIFEIIPIQKLNLKEWSELYNELPVQIPFYHPTYIENLIDTEVYPDGLSLIKGSRNGRIHSLNLIVQSKRRLGVKELEIWSISGSDHVSILSRNPESTFKSLVQYFKGKFDLVKFSFISEEFREIITKNVSGLRIYITRRIKCRYIRLPENEASFWSNFKGKTRSTLKRKLKIAEKAGIRFEEVKNENLIKTFELMSSYNAERFRKIGIESRFSQPLPQKFHTTLVRKAERNGKSMIRLIAAHKNEEVLGGFYGFITGQDYFYFNSGFNLKYQKYSIGLLLMLKTILFSIENGLRRFDLLRGNEEYKKFWAKEYVYNYSGIFALSIKGFTYLTLMKLWIMIKTKLK